MVTLRVSFFLFVFLFHSFAFSEPTTILEVSKKADTVFTEFVTNLLLQGNIANSEEELDNLTKSGWLDDISVTTENWTGSEAREFLSTLQASDLQLKSILNILLSTDYLRVLKEESAFTFSEQPTSSSSNERRLTAGEVFLNYVDNYLGTTEIENRMGPEWLTRIFDHTKSWTVEDATDFLVFLESSGVKLDSILRLLQATDYLEKLKAEQTSFRFLQESSLLAVESVALETIQQVSSQNIILDQSVGDIFIERAKQYFRVEFEDQKEKKYKNMTYEEAFQKKMGAGWENKIRENTKSWTTQDTRAFLDHLVNRIGETATLNRIKTSSYFLKMTYSEFLKQVKLYERYIGKDGVSYRLNISLSGFQQGDIIEIKTVTEFLEEYLGSREIIEVMMLKTLGGFAKLSSNPNAQTNLTNIQDVIAYLSSIGTTEEQIKSMILGNFEGFVQATRKKLETKRQLLKQEETIGIVFTSDEIDKMIEESIQDFLRIDLKKVKKMIEYLKEIGFKDEQIKDMAIRNLRGLSNNPEILKNKKEALTQAETIGVAFTSDEIDKMIVKSIQAFLQVDLKKVKNMIATLKKIGFKDEQIKDMATRNLKGLALDPQTLQDKRQSLTTSETIGIAFTYDEVNKMIVKSIQAFFQADFEKVKNMVATLKKIGFKDEQIKEMIIQSLKGLAVGDPQTLQEKRASLTKSETIGIAFTYDEIDRIIEESIQDFLQVDLKKVKKMVEYLKEIGFKDDQIKDMAMRNLQGLTRDHPETLKSKREALTKKETIGIAFTSDEIDKMIEESLQSFLQADLEKVKNTVTHLQESGFKHNQVKKMAIRNLQGLAEGDPETLKNKREALTKKETIGIAFTSDEIDKMIIENIHGFLQADLEKVKNMIATLKKIDFEDDQIKDIVIRSLLGLASSDPQTLEDKRHSLTKTETIGIVFTYDEIDKMIVKSIQIFLLADLEKVKKIVTYLKDKSTGIGLEDDQIKDIAIRDLNGFSVIKSYELKNMIEVLKQEPQLSKIKEETLMLKIRDMIITQNLISFYNNFDANLKALICAESLSN